VSEESIQLSDLSKAQLEALQERISERLGKSTATTKKRVRGPSKKASTQSDELTTPGRIPLSDKQRKASSQDANASFAGWKKRLNELRKGNGIGPLTRDDEKELFEVILVWSDRRAVGIKPTGHSDSFDNPDPRITVFDGSASTAQSALAGQTEVARSAAGGGGAGQDDGEADQKGEGSQQ
jgi:hypothetical protein